MFSFPHTFRRERSSEPERTGELAAIRQRLEQFSFEVVSDGQGLCPWNPLGEMISPRPPQQGMYNFKALIAGSRDGQSLAGVGGAPHLVGWLR